MYKPDNYNNKQNVEPKFSKTKTIPSKSFYLSSFPRCNKQQANFSFHFIGDFSGKCRKSKIRCMFQYWVDRDKPMNQQIGLSGAEPVLRFMVKFYIPDPSQLEEEYTRSESFVSSYQSCKRSIGFHNHGEGSYKGLLLVESATCSFIFKALLRWR